MTDKTLEFRDESLLNIIKCAKHISFCPESITSRYTFSDTTACKEIVTHIEEKNLDKSIEGLQNLLITASMYLKTKILTEDHEALAFWLERNRDVIKKALNKIPMMSLRWTLGFFMWLPDKHEWRAIQKDFDIYISIAIYILKICDDFKQNHLKTNETIKDES